MTMPILKRKRSKRFKKKGYVTRIKNVYEKVKEKIQKNKKKFEKTEKEST